MISWNYSLTIYKGALVGFLDGSDGRESACSTGDLSLIPEFVKIQEVFPGDPQPRRRNGNPLQYSCLENPMDRGAWQVTVHGVAELDTTEQLTVSLVVQ